MAAAAAVKGQKKPRRRNRPQKNPAKPSRLPSGSRRNVCLIKLPKSCHLQSCPLMSWCFNKRMRDNVLSFRMANHPLGAFWAAAYRRMTMRPAGKKPDCAHVFPDFLKATLRAMNKRYAKRKDAPAEKAAKPRRRYSDEEIFYRLAEPSAPNEADAGPSSAEAKTPDAAAGVLSLPQSLEGALLPVVG